MPPVPQPSRPLVRAVTRDPNGRRETVDPSPSRRLRRRARGVVTRSQITPRDDDRELQTEQAIVGLPPRKLQPDRMDARSWFGMTFAKESPAWCAMGAVRFRREADMCEPQDKFAF